MPKKIFYDEDARTRLIGGAEVLYKAVKTTLGPKGRNVVIGNSYGEPTITHDGVTVAKSIDIADEDNTLGYKTGAELIKSAASKMNDKVGDGTTTITVLTYHLLVEANKLIVAGCNPMVLRRELEKAAEIAITELDKLAENIEGNKTKLAQIGTISAADPEIGKLVAEVVAKVGKDGMVTVEQGQGLELESEIVEGFTFDRGFISSYMATDTNRMEAVYDNIPVFITDKKVSSIEELLPVLELVAQNGKKELLIIAEDVDGDALPTLILNKLKGAFNTLAVKAPAFGENRTNILSDIGVLTGARVISQEKGEKFADVSFADIGTARKVVSTKDKTTIIEGGGKEVASRIEELIIQIEGAKSEYDRENLEKRRASLEGKVAIIRVGGTTETEINEKKDRVDDAVAAVKAAVEGGVVAGGGITPLDISFKIKPTDQGSQILKQALTRPFKILLENAGLEASEWLPELRSKRQDGLGVNVMSPTPKLIDMKEAGIIDPALVTKQAIQNAVSIAGTALTMGALVVEIPAKEQAPQSPMGMM